MIIVNNSRFVSMHKNKYSNYTILASIHVDIDTHNVYVPAQTNKNVQNRSVFKLKSQKSNDDWNKEHPQAI